METMVFGKKVAGKILSIKDNLKAIGHEEHEIATKDVCDGTLDSWEILTEIRKQVWEYAGIVRVESELKELTKYLADMRTKIESE